MNHADKDVGIFAAQLYLESLNVLGSHFEPPRPSCFDDMAQDVPKFIELYCKGEKATKNDEQCETLNTHPVRHPAPQGAEARRARRQGRRQARRSTTTRRAATAYFEMWRKYCEDPVATARSRRSARSATRSSTTRRRPSRPLASSRRRSRFAERSSLDEKYEADNSPLAKKATYEIGGNYQAIAVYDQAAEWFEKYAKRRTPKGEFADKALWTRSCSGSASARRTRRSRTRRRFNKNYGGAKPAQTAQIAFAIGAHYGEKEDWDKARRRARRRR